VDERDGAYEDACDDEIDPRMSLVLAAAEEGDVSALAELFEETSLVNAVGEDGDTALHIACLYGQKAVVDECLQRGAIVQATDEDGSTPLHDASAGGFADIVARLLAEGAQIDAVDSDGDTPLHHACNGGHANVLALLLEQAGDRRSKLLAIQNQAGATAADLAEEADVQQLLARGEPIGAGS